MDPAEATILRELLTALEAVVEDAGSAREDRARFGQENRDAHAGSASNVARVDGKIDALSLAITAARIESAGVTSAFTSAIRANEQTMTLLRNLIYAGATVLVAVTGALLYATLTLRGIDADAAMRAGRMLSAPQSGVPDGSAP